MKRLFLLILIGFIAWSCNSERQQYKPVKIVGTTVLIDSCFDENPNKAALEVLLKYKPGVQKLNDSVIGYNNQTIIKSYEYSPVANFTAEVIKEEASRIFNTKIDFAIVNKGGVRAELPKGNITISDVYKVVPFENRIVKLELNAKDLKAMFNSFNENHQPALAGVRFHENKNGDNIVVINGNNIQNNKKYIMATIDYLIDGGDNFIDKTIVTEEVLERSDVVLREAMINYILRNSPLNFRSK